MSEVNCHDIGKGDVGHCATAMSMARCGQNSFNYEKDQQTVRDSKLRELSELRKVEKSK